MVSVFQEEGFFCFAQIIPRKGRSRMAIDFIPMAKLKNISACRCLFFCAAKQASSISATNRASLCADRMKYKKTSGFSKVNHKVDFSLRCKILQSCCVQ